jgi:3-hydroxyisobutyrate dehydrogenase-like beta-hydroxyacid dehydrogenase
MASNTAKKLAFIGAGLMGAPMIRRLLLAGFGVRVLTAVFDVLSQRHTRIGDIGAGQTLKLCNQLIVGSNLVATAESLALARASGLNMNIVPDALAGGFADSLPLQIFGRRMAAGVTVPVLGELNLMLKDLRAVEGLAGIKQCHLPLMAAALECVCRARRVVERCQEFIEFLISVAYRCPEKHLVQKVTAARA